METKVVKKQMSFRLNEVLVGRLKAEAKRANRSLSNYVECILMDGIYSEPNETTLEAIKEARSGKFAGTVDTSSMEAFIKSCKE
jgi:predicted DNA-binding protein